jgi:RNA polymerase sigma-70 factor (ECF subfamily)
MPPPEDHAESLGVVERAKAGDPDALSELWRALNPPLLRYLRGRVGTGGEDVAAQTWLDAARSLPNFDGDTTDFRRWLFTIARRRLVDEIRRRGRRSEQLAARPDAGGRDDASFAMVDDLDRALATVRRLPPDQADAVLLRVVADVDVGQVAIIMGRSEGSVRVLVHRGLRRLQEWAESAVTDGDRPAMYREQ